VNRLNLSGYKELKNFEDHSMSILVLLPVRGGGGVNYLQDHIKEALMYLILFSSDNGIA
jgi:hypothetical protein